MKEIDITTLQIIEVPDNYIECSVCGKFHPREAFCKEGTNIMSRTNCVDCYNLSMDEMKALDVETKSIKMSQDYRTAVKNLQIQCAYFANSVSVKDMMAALKKLPKDARLFVGQEGYYSDGELASCYVPTLRDKQFDYIDYFQIGYSSQNY